MRLLLGAVAVGTILALLILQLPKEVSLYTDFQTAAQKPGTTYHVVASWIRREDAFYDPAQDVFWFWAQDTLGTVRRVRYPDPMPINFEAAQKVVLIGYAQDSLFIAEKILMKCPSKYKEE